MRSRFFRIMLALILVFAECFVLPAASWAQSPDDDSLAPAPDTGSLLQSPDDGSPLPEPLSAESPRVCIDGTYYGGYRADTQYLFRSLVPMGEEEIRAALEVSGASLLPETDRTAFCEGKAGSETDGTAFCEGKAGSETDGAVLNEAGTSSGFSADDYNTFAGCFDAMILNKVTEMVDVSRFRLTVSALQSAWLASSYEQWLTGVSYACASTDVYRVTSVMLVYSPAYETEFDAYEERVTEIVDCARQYRSEIEQLLFLHDYITDNTDYDDTFTRYMAYELLRDGTGVCNAQAMLFKDVLNRLGIENRYVSSRAGNHIWNALVLKNQWYMADVTWDNTIDGSHCYENFLVSEDTLRLECRHNWSDYGRNTGDPLFGVVCTDSSLEKKFWREDASFVLEYEDGIPCVHYGEHRFLLDGDKLRLGLISGDTSYCLTGFCGGENSFGYDADCGAYKNLVWSLAENGSLSVSGAGQMINYTSCASAPWYALRWVITQIDIGDGVTAIGTNAFGLCCELQQMRLPRTLTKIAGQAFSSCSNLSAVYLVGTQLTWDAVLVESGNDAVLAAELFFRDDFLPFVEVMYIGNICSVDPFFLSDEDAVVFAQYADGKLLRTECVCCDGETAEFEIDTDADRIRVFVLDDEWIPVTEVWSGNLS